eukprot:12348629-Alexandrium_andersonii.AAC.1
MSASLVGSEMCIRDRVTTASNALIRGRIASATERPGQPTHQVALSAAAVSYTHLTLPTICSV